MLQLKSYLQKNKSAFAIKQKSFLIKKNLNQTTPILKDI